MLRARALFLSLSLHLAFVGAAIAHGEHSTQTLALGEFKIVNTGGFVESNGLRRELTTDIDIGTINISLAPDKRSLVLEINLTSMTLYSLERGLASFQWDSEDTTLLHQEDILDVSGKQSLEDIHAWAADIKWPDLGTVKLVLFNYDRKSYGGFLISKPEGKTVVRQMELHRLSGPRHRAGNIFSYDAPEHRR